MAKSNYLSFFLFALVVWLCFYFYSGSIIDAKISSGKQCNGSGNRSLYASVISGSDHTKRELLRQIYLKELGVREFSNRNDGERVETYLAYTGNKKGDAWCAAFVCWVLGKAGVVNPRSAWSPDLFPKNRIVWQYNQNKKMTPGKGDVFAIWFADKGRIAHCGFVDEWNDKWVVTVEGNTTESGSREGDGVYRKRRMGNTLFAVATWVVRKEDMHDL